MKNYLNLLVRMVLSLICFYNFFFYFFKSKFELRLNLKKNNWNNTTSEIILNVKILFSLFTILINLKKKN